MPVLSNNLNFFFKDDDTLTEQISIMIGISYNGKPIAGVINQPFFNRDSVDKNLCHRIIWALYGIGIFIWF